MRWWQHSFPVHTYVVTSSRISSCRLRIFRIFIEKKNWRKKTKNFLHEVKIPLARDSSSFNIFFIKPNKNWNSKFREISLRELRINFLFQFRHTILYDCSKKKLKFLDIDTRHSEHDQYRWNQKPGATWIRFPYCVHSSEVVHALEVMYVHKYEYTKIYNAICRFDIRIDSRHAHHYIRLCQYRKIITLHTRVKLYYVCQKLDAQLYACIYLTLEHQTRTLDQSKRWANILSCIEHSVIELIVRTTIFQSTYRVTT